MFLPDDIELKKYDNINQEIWQHNPLNTQDAKQFIKQKFGDYGYEKIVSEIKSGCSPCPDIVTKDFGIHPSIMFISTVYAGIHKYVGEEYNRKTDSWEDLANWYYKRIVLSQKGIYPIIADLYSLITDKVTNLDFCLTDLVKTVLFNKNGGTDKIHDSGAFRHYFLKYEYDFLKRRLNQISNWCVIFTFKDVATFYTIEAFKELSNELEVFSGNLSKEAWSFIEYT